MPDLLVRTRLGQVLVRYKVAESAEHLQENSIHRLSVLREGFNPAMSTSETPGNEVDDDCWRSIGRRYPGRRL